MREHLEINLLKNVLERLKIMDTKLKVLEKINLLNTEFECININPEFADTKLFCEKYSYPMEKSCNTIIIASKKEPKQFCACVVIATTKLDVNKRVKKVMGVSKASFASADEMKQLTGMEVGGVTVFSLPDDLPIYVDERIMDLDWIILGGGGRDKKFKTSPQIFHKLKATIIENLAV
ncbi:MAG: YbaK/EbsC family protein [SAR324 cluster bacterium]|nr:YbaK/EbsC family protein [SAR324 cluster bacterium]